MSENLQMDAAIFHRQRDKFASLIQEAVDANSDRDSESPVSSATLAEFADDLIICPTEDAVRLRIRRSLTEAQKFLSMVDEFGVQLEKEVEKGGSLFSNRDTSNDSPFFILGGTLKEFFERANKKNPEFWAKQQF